MLLSVRGLRTGFFTDEGVSWPVDDVTFNIPPGETVGLVGESGSGKSMVALSIIRLVPPPGRIVDGEILLEGRDLRRLGRSELREVRGGRIGMVFQDAATSLNPVYRVGDQIAAVIRLHQGLNASDARRAAIHLLGDLGIVDPEERARAYPHELSGGMRQRVMLAVAVAGRPRLLIADEPTTGLDATVQAEICDLLKWIQGEHDMSILLISHDLGMVVDMSDHVMVMYAGRLVEVGHWSMLAADPLHPYTRALVAAVPRLGSGSDGPLKGIPGTVPDPAALPPGCAFEPRCPIAAPACSDQAPPLTDVGDRLCACYEVGGDG